MSGEGLGGSVLAGFRQLLTSFLLSGVSPRLHCCGSPATVFSKVMILRAFQLYPAAITSCVWTLRIVMAAVIKQIQWYKHWALCCLVVADTGGRTEVECLRICNSKLDIDLLHNQLALWLTKTPSTTASKYSKSNPVTTSVRPSMVLVLLGAMTCHCELSATFILVTFFPR